MAEEWRPIPGWPRYSVSSEGRVRGPRKMLTPKRKPSGYVEVFLSDRPTGRRKTPLVHKLVTLAFLGPRPEGKQVNHINSIRDDNRACNLEYLTAKENCQHRRTNGTFPEGENTNSVRLTRVEVRELRALRQEGLTYKALGERFGVHMNTARMAAIGATWQGI